MLKNRSRYLGILALTATIIFFSTFEVVSKVLAPFMEPLQITFFRFSIGGLILLPFAIWRINKKKYVITGIDYLRISVLGFINIVVSMGLIQWGLIYADASACATVFSMNPLFVILFARIFLGEKFSAAKLAGIVLGLIGVVIIFSDKFGGQDLAFEGLSLVTGAAITFAFYTVAGKMFMSKRSLDPLVITSFSFLAGSLFLVPLILFFGLPLVPDIRNILPQLLYMSIVVTGIAYVLYFEGISRLETGGASMLYFFKPALASLLSVVFLRERPGINLFIGIVIIATGIMIVQFGGRLKSE